jgi:hypothetical protein
MLELGIFGDIPAEAADGTDILVAGLRLADSSVALLHHPHPDTARQRTHPVGAT